MALMLIRGSLTRCISSAWRKQDISSTSVSVILLHEDRREVHSGGESYNYQQAQAKATNTDGLLYEHHMPTTPLQKALLTAGSAFMSLYNPYRHVHSGGESYNYQQAQAKATNTDGLLYEHHMPTTPLQKALLTAGSAFMSLYNPYRHDMVAVFGETTGCVALPRLLRLMEEDPVGQEILEQRPRINHDTVDMTYLASLPEGTFGKWYHDFMVSNKISADTRAPVRFVDDPDLAYVLQRYREIHDIYHTLLGMPINMMGEVVVKWFEAVQTRLPMCALGALFGPVRLKNSERRELVQHFIPAVFKMAPKSKLLLNVYFEKHWEMPIDELRDLTRIYPLHHAR